MNLIPRFAAAALVLFSSIASAAEDASAPVSPPAHEQAPQQGAAASGPSWALRLPKENLVTYHGVVNFDSAGSGSGNMVYPAVGGVAGLVVGVLTHSAIQSSINSSQKQKMREQADLILAPYQDVLKGFTHKELMPRGLDRSATGKNKKIVDGAEIPSGMWIVESAPVYLLTQDHQAIVLENTVTIYTTDPNKPSYQNVIRVVSSAQNAKDVPAFWTADLGDKLKEMSASLLALSLDAAIADATNNAPDTTTPINKTIRYMEGGTEKMERGQLLNSLCDRTLFKNLRGWLMSVPARSTQSANCTPPTDQ
jgi:hypothetical protein